jgi:protein SCO1/2
MRSTISATIAAAAALWLSAPVMASQGSAAAAADDSRWGADFFPNVALTTHQGKTVRFYDDLVKGKIVAIDLIYTTCKYACPLETARLAQVQRLLGDRMGRDVFFYSITIDPDHDTPTVLAEYAEKYRAGPGWLFLTGAKADIELIGKKLGIYAGPDPSNPDGHVPYLLVGNQSTGQWMRNSATDNPKFIARTIGEWMDSWHSPTNDALKSSAAAAALTFNKGEYTYGYHCAACHGIGNGTNRIGPDLAGVTGRRDREWLRRFITAPDKMNADGDPIALALRAEYRQVRMPNLKLSDEDVSAVIDYLAGHDGAAQQPPQTPLAATASSTAAAAELPAIVNAYVRIQQALHADTTERIRDNAGVIEARARSLGSVGEPIRTSAAALMRADDLKAARAAFGTLGDAIMSYVKASGSSYGDGVTVAFCPMVQKYWMQRGDTVQNPFYGKAMSDCGRIVR